jgi:hypothetical protein
LSGAPPFAAGSGFAVPLGSAVGDAVAVFPGPGADFLPKFPGGFVFRQTERGQGYGSSFGEYAFGSAAGYGCYHPRRNNRNHFPVTGGSFYILIVFAAAGTGKDSPKDLKRHRQ